MLVTLRGKRVKLRQPTEILGREGEVTCNELTNILQSILLETS